MSCKIKNKQASFLCLLLLFSITGITAKAQSFGSGRSEVDTLRLLFIGNSFSWNAAEYIDELAEEAGHPLSLQIAGIGGASMQKHWDLQELAEKEPQNPAGKPYNGKSLKEVLTEQQWDIVSLQQVSILSGNINTYRPYARLLSDFVKRHLPEAKIVLMQTWPYRTDSKDFTQISEGRHAKSSQEMWENLEEAYKTAAKELGTEIVPVGNAFWGAASSKKWGFKKDFSFDDTKAKYPGLPNQDYSLHRGYFWNAEGNLILDSHHANDAGCFLGSLVWYAYLFGESPKKLDFSPDKIPERFDKYLKKVAHSVTKNL